MKMESNNLPISDILQRMYMRELKAAELQIYGPETRSVKELLITSLVAQRLMCEKIGDRKTEDDIDQMISMVPGLK
ncbi:MAG: hypothetical protein A2079_04395 [Geobacteraceae bacterium GWC2_48_7]|nr:MAG: hypothetical protein A2079_04395 [Geobacteraceae bacterium GWC2_48_7]